MAERDELRWRIGRDELTGLMNRSGFNEAAAPPLRQCRAAVAVLLDLNGFKLVNDEFGHHVGDRLLSVVGQRLAHWAGQDVIVARLGGDEFVGLAVNHEVNPQDGWWRAGIAKLSSAIAEPFRSAGQVMSITSSIGVAPTNCQASLSTLLRRADQAMYRAKATGQRWVTWQPVLAGPYGDRLGE